MYSVVVLVLSAFLIDGVRTRPDTNLNLLNNFEVSGTRRTIEVKEPGQQDNIGGGNFGGDNGGNGDDNWASSGKRGLFMHRKDSDGAPIGNEEGNGDDDWVNNGKKGGFFRQGKEKDGAPPRGVQEGDDEQEMQDWINGGKKKHNWFGRNKNGQGDGQGEGNVEGKKGKSDQNPVERRWNHFVGGKLQDAMSAVGIKGQAQTVVVQGAIHQGVLKPDMAPPGMQTQNGFFYYIFYPMNTILGFSNIVPFAKATGGKKG